MKFSDEEIKFLIKVLVGNYAESETDFDGNNIGDTGMSGKLIGKLVLSSDDYQYMRYYNEQRKKRHEKSILNKRLFMGAGYHSLVNLNKLHRGLDFAASQLSGLEQNGGMGTEYDLQMEEQGVQNIKDVIKDIMLAFDIKSEDLK